MQDEDKALEKKEREREKSITVDHHSKDLKDSVVVIKSLREIKIPMYGKMLLNLIDNYIIKN